MSKSIQDRLNSFFTVGDLLDEISHLDRDTPVVISTDYGDRQHTFQALSIDGVSLLEDEGLTVVESGYSSSGLAVEDIDEDIDEDSDEEDSEEEVIQLHALVIKAS